MKIKRTRVIYLLMAAIILAGGVSATAIAAQSATERRASNIKSKGNFDFENGKVTIYSSDLIYLADEIDLLEDTYKTETVKALDQIGTYFNSDGTSMHDKGDSNISSSEAKLLPYGAIIDGIINSQSIPTERTYTGTMPGQTTETHGNISAATEANLSLGTAAWVEGKLIVGNGMDNNSSYTRGKKDGYDDGYTQGKKDGYDDGYAKGNKDGYDNGYAQGNKDFIKEIYQNVSSTKTFDDISHIETTMKLWGKFDYADSVQYQIPMTDKFLYGIAFDLEYYAIRGYDSPCSVGYEYSLTTVEGTVIASYSVQSDATGSATNYGTVTKNIFIDLLQQTFATEYDHLILDIKYNMAGQVTSGGDQLCQAHIEFTNIQARYK